MAKQVGKVPLQLITLISNLIRSVVNLFLSCFKVGEASAEVLWSVEARLILK